MKLQRWDVTAWGGLADLTHDDLARHPLIVVNGENESGKSTLLDFLTTTLYGYSPARLAEHPSAPWDGSPLEGTAVFRDPRGGDIEIHRRLQRTAEGRMRRGDEDGDIGNHPVWWTGAISRQTYMGLHRLDTDVLDGLDDDTWRLFEERLLGGAGFDFLRPSGEVLAELQSRADALWRPDRKNRGRARRLADAMKKLGEERDTADGHARRVLEVRQALAAKSWQADELAAGLRELVARRQRAEVLLPVLRTLQEIDELRRQADEHVPDDGLPDDVRGRLRELSASMSEKGRRSEELSARIDDHQRRLDKNADHEDILSVEDEVRALLSEAAVHSQDRVHLIDLDRTRDSLEAELSARGATLLSGSLDDEARAALQRLDTGELQARVKSWEEARRRPEIVDDQLKRAREAVDIAAKDVAELPDKNEEIRLRARAEELRTLQSRDAVLTEMHKEMEAAEKGKQPDTKGARERRRLGFGMITTGALLGVLMIVGGADDVILSSLMAVGLITVGIQVIRRRPADTNRPDAQRAKILEGQVKKMRASLDLHTYEAVETHLQECDEKLTLAAARPTLERRLINAQRRIAELEQEQKTAAKELEAARKAIDSSLEGIPVLDSRRQRPGLDVVADIEALRSTLRDIARRKGEREALARRANEREERALVLAETLGMEPSGEPMDIAPLVQERLHQALAARRQAREAKSELPHLQGMITELEQALEAARAEHDALSEKLAALDPADDDPEAGLERLERARSARRQADELERDLHARHPDWQERGDEARQAQRDGLELDLPTEERVSLAQSIAQLEEAGARLRAERDELQAEFTRLSGERELADVDGELAALREQEQRLLVARDRAVILGAVIREAEARWRKRHQPGVLARAGEHLATLSGGRDEQLLVRGRQLAVQRAGRERPVSVADGLSRSARERVHLALRVAIAEHLDPEGNLPLLLDAVLVNWDEPRLADAGDWLMDVAGRRQVFLCTSRPGLAQRLAADASAHVLSLPAPATPAAEPVTAGSVAGATSSSDSKATPTA